MNERYAPILWIPLLGLACSTPTEPSRRGLGSPASGAAPQAAEHAWSAPKLERAVIVRDGRTGRRLSFAGLLDELAEADAVFLGETHTDETTHRVELGVYEGLWKRRAGRVVLALEMFERDVQDALNAYLRGDSTEEEFLAQARPWRNYRTAYRPLIEHARREGGVVVASNFPRSLRAQVSGAGLDALAGAEAELAPAALLANTPEYWQRVDNAVRGHLAMLGSRSAESRLTSVQSLWDNSMGDACSLALETHPGHLVLHVNGGFHSSYWDGTLRQFQLRRPDARARTVAIVPTTHPAVVDVPAVPSADYIVFVEERASDVNDGKFSVSIPRSLEYRLHMPEDLSQPLPLLIWVADGGLTAQDGMDLWKDRLGDEVAIAVLEPLFPEAQADLGEGGRWYRANSFSADVDALHVGIERIWAYLLRHYPIDPQRVCLAGEGTGATVVALTSLLTARMPHKAVALSPRQFAKVKDVPLPLAEYRGEDEKPSKSLLVLSGLESGAWWRPELGEYSAKAGFDETQWQLATDDPWRTEHERASALRAALGLEPPARDNSERHLYFVVAGDSPRRRHWARLEALERGALEETAIAIVAEAPKTPGAIRLSLEIRPQDFSGAKALPLCPGPFGGTTILALPATTDAKVLAEWLAIEADDPLNERSRFHRLRIATVDGERELKKVVAKLKDKGRKNLLIVPATFCADVATMRALRSSLGEVADELTLHWRPGLGGI